ncbi:MAG: phosphodiester glycosidase family protein, partial [Acidimicrobiales bacterium]
GGSLSRGDMMVLFSESDEYLIKTATAWSVFASPDRATLAADGYELRSIPGGKIAVIDYDRVDFSASHERCSVASINGNWFFNPESANPTPVGFAVIDGVHVPGAANRADRGVLGERYRPNGASEEIVWVYQGEFNINSNLDAKDGRVLESWHSWRPTGTPAVDNPAEWRWAAAGIPLIINGQVWPGFYGISTSDYTHYTLGHSFVAFDKDTGQLAFGSTRGMTSAGLISWATANGYEDLIKFDGGGSVEFNVNKVAQVAGTRRNVPVWLGIGC